VALDIHHTPLPSLPASSRVRSKGGVSGTPNTKLRIPAVRRDGVDGTSCSVGVVGWSCGATSLGAASGSKLPSLFSLSLRSPFFSFLLNV
jgi:hypothetical protein